MLEVLGLPQAFRSELLDELDAPFGHRLRGNADDRKARHALFTRHVHFALQVDEGQGRVAVPRKACMVFFGGGGAERDQVLARVLRNGRTDLQPDGRVTRWREELEVTAFQHRTAIAGAGRDRLAGFVARRLHRERSQQEAQLRQHLGRRPYFGHEVRYVVNVERAGRRFLPLGDGKYGSLVRHIALPQEGVMYTISPYEQTTRYQSGQRHDDRR